MEDSGVSFPHPEVRIERDRHFLFSDDTPLGFDVFSAVFWMISRYEEYAPSSLDEHGRFHVGNALAYQKGFLNYPVVQFWTKYLAEFIQKIYPDFRFSLPPFKQTVTVDVDHAFAFRGKPIKRQIAATFRDLVTFKWGWLIKRIEFYSGKRDPFASYDYIHKTCAKHQADEIYFLLAGNYGSYDKNVPCTSQCMQELGKKLASYAQVGMHPSYGSYGNLAQIAEEKKRIEFLTAKEVFQSRQHFLRFTFPQTAEQLLKVNIREDFSLGFADASGFRAGMAISFPFYNLHTESKTDLLLTPFSYMDGTLNEHQKLTTLEAKEVVTQLKNTVREFGGNFISIWHNHSLSETQHWKGWRRVFEHSLNV